MDNEKYLEPRRRAQKNYYERTKLKGLRRKAYFLTDNEAEKVKAFINQLRNERLA